jgi:hypothetical protein
MGRVVWRSHRCHRLKIILAGHVAEVCARLCSQGSSETELRVCQQPHAGIEVRRLTGGAKEQSGRGDRRAGHLDSVAAASSGIGRQGKNV